MTTMRFPNCCSLSAAAVYLAFQCAGEGVGQTGVCVGTGQAHAQAVAGFSDACPGETGRRGAVFAGRGQEDD